MKKITIAILIFLGLLSYANKSGENFYYNKNEKIYLTLKSDKLFIKLSKEADKEAFLSYVLKDDYIKLADFNPIPLDIFVYLESKDGNSISYQTLNKYRENNAVVSAQLMYEDDNAIMIGIIDEFIIKQKTTTTFEKLQNLASKYGCTIIGENRYVKNQFLISICKSLEYNSLQMANIFYESGLFEFSVPNFFTNMANSNFSNPDDPYFEDQWGLKNIGQYSGMNNIDINIEPAWAVTQGNPMIKIAVSDTGVDLTHPDLQRNLLPGYNFILDTIGGGHDGDFPHGTACAGIISALKNNNEGISGVAPDCKLIPMLLMSSTWGTINTANSFYWAGQNGADVINCSWGTMATPVITDAINYVVNYGREGKGTVLVFSAMNSNSPFVEHPANLPNVIAVGAISPCGERKSKSPLSCDGEDWGSNYGVELDIVAPGVFISTTDIQGNDGYNKDTTSNDYLNRDYTKWFNGTSAAAPFVAGVAALILSINPDLYWYEVKNIIESTAQKVRPDLYNYEITPNRPNGTWHEEMGYGLVDAYAAVIKAQCIKNTTIIENALIGNSVLWNTPIYAKGTITIDDRATLTITTEVKCDVNVKFIVKPGGKLVINGGKLTNVCNDKLWQGIIVQGNSTQPQTPQHQGTIELINATIENAICGVSVGEMSIINSGGGIISASNTLFSNNLCAIEYSTYQSINDNLGNFTKCTFTIDNNNLFATNGKTFENYVRLNGVRGVTFSGCTFNNEANNSGKGIFSIDAGFNVLELCEVSVPFDCECPEIEKTPSTFTNLNFGIHSFNTGNPYLINIDQSLFVDNSVSTSINNSNNYSFTRNEINVGNTGLLSENSSGYRIEENNFILGSNTGIFDIPPIGIDMRSSGSDENYIYKNYFENLNKGISASLSNASSPFFLEGLQFICNEFRDNLNDIYVSNLINTAVRAYQVSPDESADNIFYGISSPNGSSLNIANGQPFVYYYSTNNVHVPYNPTLNVEEIRDVIANSCRSTFCTTPRAGNTDIEVYCNLQQEYDNLMIEFINGDYAKILFNLNSGEFSEDEIYNAMQLQSQLSSISNEMREISGNAIRAIIQDDVLNIELLKAWYTVIRTLTAKYALAEAHCYSSDFSLADMVLCEIPEIFEFNEFEVEEYENYMQFHNIKKNVLLSDRTWAELRDDEIAELQSVAEKQGRASTMAKGILCFFYDICYEDDDIIEVKSGETPILRTIKEKRKDNEDFLEFVVSDNVLKVNVNNVQKIEFFDVAGRIVCTESSKNNVTIGHLPSGVYIIKIYTDDLKVESRKFIKK